VLKDPPLHDEKNTGLKVVLQPKSTGRSACATIDSAGFQAELA